MRGGFSHFAVRKPSLRVGYFNIICWGVCAAIGLFGFLKVQSFWMLLFIPVGFLVGFPVPNAGSPHAWLINEWRARKQWGRNQGVALHSPLSIEDTPTTTRLGEPELIFAKVVERNGEITELPLLTTSDRTHVTIVLRTGGASSTSLRSDGYGKFSWDLAWMNSLSRAVSVTKVEDLHFVMTRLHRPSNKQPGYLWNQTRGNQQAIAAAGREGDESADAVIGRNALEAFARAHSMAGEPTNLAILRMPWPRRFNVKINLEEPTAFRKTELFKTISAILAAYQQNGVEADFNDLIEMRALWNEALRLVDLPAKRMQTQRDKELVKASGSTKPIERKLDQAISIRHSPPGKPAWVWYDGSYHVAGYASEINAELLRPGFQEHAVVLSDDTYYTFTTYIEAPLKQTEESKSREKERWLGITRRWNPFNKHLTNPAEDRQMREAIAKRKRLDEGSQRAANSFIIASVVADSPEEAEARWEDMTVQMASTYTFDRCKHPSDVEDILLAQLGIRAKQPTVKSKKKPSRRQTRKSLALAS